VAVAPPTKRQAQLSEPFKYNVFDIIRHHIHPEQQKVMILPGANYDWTHLSLHDYNSIED
jgi:hypothetical protein